MRYCFLNLAVYNCKNTNAVALVGEASPDPSANSKFMIVFVTAVLDVTLPETNSSPLKIV